MKKICCSSHSVVPELVLECGRSCYFYNQKAAEIFPQTATRRRVSKEDDAEVKFWSPGFYCGGITQRARVWTRFSEQASTRFLQKYREYEQGILRRNVTHTVNSALLTVKETRLVWKQSRVYVLAPQAPSLAELQTLQDRALVQTDVSVNRK